MKKEKATLNMNNITFQKKFDSDKNPKHAKLYRFILGYLFSIKTYIFMSLTATSNTQQ